MENFNYCIAHYWPESKTGSIGCYTYFTVVHQGTLEDAQDFLEYVKKKSPDREWKIFKVEELVCK